MNTMARLTDFGEVAGRQHSVYGSSLVKSMIEARGIYRSPKTGVTYQIPTHFGFCYGVEKSIDMAFEARKYFPDRRIFLTHDIIHNPQVNQDLLAQGVKVLRRDDDQTLILDDVKPKDVVIIAAFGSRFREVAALKEKGCVIVDTTCGAIVGVWKRVEKYASSGFTSIIHGIWKHEETQATASQASKFNGHFLIIRDINEAKKIRSLVKGEISEQDFMTEFKNRVSPNFNPCEYLKKIGIASQTTMLRSETLEVQDFLRKLYLEIHGEEKIKDYFLLYDTICSATQERQDALKNLLDTKPDVMVVIGGFNSSNTTHLSEISSARYPTYHIQGAEDILSRDEIRHMCPKTLKVMSSPWHFEKLKSVGIATGASTPDLLIEKVIERFEFCMKGKS